jgi:Tol biopolymer transport system component
VSVSIGGATRDTARTTFAVSCARTWAIAYSRPDWSSTYGTDVPMIRVTNASGSSQASFALGSAPAWSPDGTQLAFVRVACDYYYYYYYYCYPFGLGKTGTTGAEAVPLTSDGSDADPAWRPDGARIAFTRGSTLYLMNADGGGLTPVPAAGSAASPDWSPNGSTLAFTCQVDDGNDDICVMNADGSGLVRLTADTARDVRPAWSPDGSRIAFVTTRYSGSQELALMNADGSAVTRLAPGTGGIQPAWSADGTKIVYTAFTCSIYAGCTMHGLFMMNADGSGSTQITSGRDVGAAWRP